MHVYNVTFNAARLVDSVSWQTPDFENVVIGLIRKECGRKPVLIINDMTDQHFKGGQRLPPVGYFDRAAVLSRKVQVAFPNYPIRGALQIKKSDGDKKEGGGGSVYLFSAVPMSEPVTRTIDAVARSMAPIAGFYLLPIESADMVAALSAKLTGKGKPASRWVMFIGQHQGGALRQIITRDGQLAMTRMTPVSEAEKNHEVWAQEVSQEFKATLSYLSRFGFAPQDGVDVIVICDKTSGQILEQLIDLPCNFTSLTVSEAANTIGLSVGLQEDNRHADPLHVAWAGRKTRFTLPMSAADLDRINKPRQALAMAMLLMIIGAAWMGWQFLSLSQKMLENSDGISTQKKVLAQAEADYQTELDRMQALGYDVKVIQGSIKTFDYLESQRIKTLGLVKAIDTALGGELRLDGLKINYISSVDVVSRMARFRAPGGEEAITPPPQMEATLKLSFPPTIEPEDGVREVSNLRQRLEAALPGYKVSIGKNVAGLEYGDAISGTAGQSAQELAAKDQAAEIVITGDLK